MQVSIIPGRISAIQIPFILLNNNVLIKYSKSLSCEFYFYSEPLYVISFYICKALAGSGVIKKIIASVKAG